MILDGKVNPVPDIKVVRESTTAQTLDGDGGMGHLPCRQGAEWAVGRALEHGAAAVTTRNHFHFGGAGKYSRMAAARDCVGISVSSHRFNPRAGNILGVKGSSPISIALPAGEQPPVVLDMGSSFLPYDDDLFERMPFAFFKEIGNLRLRLRARGSAGGDLQPRIHSARFPVGIEPGFLHRRLLGRELHGSRRIQGGDGPLDRSGERPRSAPRVRPRRAAGRDSSGGGNGSTPRRASRSATRPGDRLEEIAAELGVETPFSRYLHTRFGDGT